MNTRVSPNELILEFKDDSSINSTYTCILKTKEGKCYKVYSVNSYRKNFIVEIRYVSIGSKKLPYLYYIHRDTRYQTRYKKCKSWVREISDAEVLELQMLHT